MTDVKTVIWQVRETDGWRDVDAPFRYGKNDGSITVYWPSLDPTLGVESVTYRADQVRQKPGVAITCVSCEQPNTSPSPAVPQMCSPR